MAITVSMIKKKSNSIFSLSLNTYNKLIFCRYDKEEKMPTNKCNGISLHKDRVFCSLLIRGAFILGWVITLYTSTYIYYAELKNVPTKRTGTLKKVLALLNFFFSFLASVYVFRYRAHVLNALAGIALTSAIFQFDLSFSKKAYTNQDAIETFVFITNVVLIVCAVGYATGIVDDYDHLWHEYSRLCTKTRKKLIK